MISVSEERHHHPSPALPLLLRHHMVRHGKSAEDKQRYRCRQCLEGHDRTFLLDYSYAGKSSAVKEQIVE